MIQAIPRKKAEANNVVNKNDLVYTLLLDMNNLMKISLVDKRMNDKGEEYGMIYQTLYQISHLLLKKDFDFVVACYDGEFSGVLRAKYLPEYKANRDKHYELALGETEYDRKIAEYCKKVISYHKKAKKPEKVRGETEDENFQRQRSIIQSILEELFVRQYMYDKVEGDDLIAYYVKHKKPNERIVIVSGDRDITQLINDEVCVYIPSMKKFITPKNAVSELGYTHENVVLKKMITGDQSDNIKGIHGVGEKGLLNMFPEIKDKKVTLDEILERSQQILDERKTNKKKPLLALENILNRVTDGSQGVDIYEINKKIIDLSEPLLTIDAERDLNEEMYSPLDPSGRDIKNVYNIIQDNGMNDLLDENRFGSLFGSFERIIKKEKEYFKKC